MEPAVFPAVETPANTPPSPAPPPAGTEITTEPPVTPTDAIPAPPKESADLCAVPEVDWVVLETACMEIESLTDAHRVWALTEKETPFAFVSRTVPVVIELAPSYSAWISDCVCTDWVALIESVVAPAPVVWERETMFVPPAPTSSRC